MDAMDDQRREDLHPCRKYEGRVTHNCLRMGEGHMAKHSVRNGGGILQKVRDLERNGWN